MLSGIVATFPESIVLFIFKLIFIKWNEIK